MGVSELDNGKAHLEDHDLFLYGGFLGFYVYTRQTCIAWASGAILRSSSTTTRLSGQGLLLPPLDNMGGVL
jgi:hypothetical protein